ncbi:energy-coupling factor transporter ATPase [Limosilactobacillus caecicola]|uniref:energy-coupling factor transporter ATPase n=1 Tax=Limosilactobacillus caecicola TaxID=2941332 RepID=UPI00204267EE|nr:energy-coupling factor transporter ATPase [Limosilactobacillus caecicola]
MVEPAIEIQQLSYTYSPGTAFAAQALTNVNLTIQRGKVTAVVGHTGSGKSTLMQLIDGLLKPTSGSITVQETKVTPDSAKKDFAALRQHVGFVFQFPESQLFADSVLEDVMFGPLNQGQSEENARRSATDALDRLHFPVELRDHSPFELSGGQMRRVAIAGVLAMKPAILILDEPTAGLDPSGRLELMNLIQKLNQEGTTIILITHQMEQVARYADVVVALQHGQLVFDGQPRSLFSNQQLVEQIGLAEPNTVAFANQLDQAGIPLQQTPLTVQELANEIIEARQKGTFNNE